MRGYEVGRAGDYSTYLTTHPITKPAFAPTKKLSPKNKKSVFTARKKLWARGDIRDIARKNPRVYRARAGIAEWAA